MRILNLFFAVGIVITFDQAACCFWESERTNTSTHKFRESTARSEWFVRHLIQNLAALLQHNYLRSDSEFEMLSATNNEDYGR